MPIDVHAHYVPPNILEAVEQRAKEFGVTMVRHPPSRACSLHFDYGLKVRPFFPKLVEPIADRLAAMAKQGADRLAAMAKQGVDRQVLSM